MNFKPNLLKIIIALIFGVAGGYYSIYIIKAGETVNQFIRFIIPLLVIFIIIYVIWSLIQKKS